MEQKVDDSTSSKNTIEIIFSQIFPYYLSLGMTYEQFYLQDPNLVIAYRQADKIRVSRQNHEMWLQGAYFHSAVVSALSGFGKKPIKYPEQPFALSEKEQHERERKLADIRLENLRQSLLNKK